MTAVAVAPRPTSASRRSHEPDVRRLIAEYEDALTAALPETDLVRAAQAFDRADRLQARLLRRTRTSRAGCGAP